MDRWRLKPGWYWWDYTADLDAQYDDFWRRNREVMKPRVTFRGDTSNARVVVFEVVGSTLSWGLPGRPSPAPRGANTRAPDLATAPAPSPSLVALVEEITGQAWDTLRRAGKAVESVGSNASSALTVLLWGAVAVVLIQVARATEIEDDD